MMAVADEVAEQTGDRDVAAWCRRETRIDRGGRARPGAGPVAGAPVDRPGGRACGRGRVDGAGRRDRAGVGRPPRQDTPTSWRRRSGCWSSTPRRSHPGELRNLGRRILDVVAPEVGEDAGAAQARGRGTQGPQDDDPDDPGQRGRDHDDPDPGAGRHRGPAADLPARVDQPPHRTDATVPWRRATAAARRDGDGRRGIDSLPDPAGSGVLLAAGAPRPGPDAEHGGTATSVVVTMDFETLKSGLGDRDHRHRPGHHGQRSPPVWRAPGTSSRPSWVGSPRSSTWAAAGGSTRPPSGGPWASATSTAAPSGCDIPAAWCEAHHLIPWSQGREDRPRRRRPPLLPPPPSGPRRPLPPRPTAQRRHPVPRRT